jgi:hypothetical protein
MRYRPIAVGCAGIAFLLALSGTTDAALASNGGHRSSCPPKQSRIIRADSVASVFRLREYFTETLEGRHIRESYIAIRGCTHGATRSFELGTPVEGVGSAGGSQGGGISGIKLRGPMAAFEQRFSSTQAGGTEPRREWRILVRDLRSGKTVHRVPTGTQTTPEPRTVGVGPTTSIAVDKRGGVAWIARVVQAPVFAAYEVHLLIGDTETVLASGGDIDPKLLSIEGGQVGWRQGGVAKSAPLSASPSA